MICLASGTNQNLFSIARMNFKQVCIYGEWIGRVDEKIPKQNIYLKCEKRDLGYQMYLQLFECVQLKQMFRVQHCESQVHFFEDDIM